MQQAKLEQIIKNKNEQRERHVVGAAEDIIEQIVFQQKLINTATNTIADLREKLTSLEVQELDVKTVLGGD